jgi:hypothetical protein
MSEIDQRTKGVLIHRNLMTWSQAEGKETHKIRSKLTRTIFFKNVCDLRKKCPK